MGKPLVPTFIMPELQISVQYVLDQALHGNETSNYELEFVSKLGEPIFLLVNATTRRDPENVVVGGKPFFSSSIWIWSFFVPSNTGILTPSSIAVVGVAQDVTEDRKHAQALREMHYLRASRTQSITPSKSAGSTIRRPLSTPRVSHCAITNSDDNEPTAASSCMYLFLLVLFGTFLFCVPAYNKTIHKFASGLTVTCWCYCCGRHCCVSATVSYTSVMAWRASILRTSHPHCELLHSLLWCCRICIAPVAGAVEFV